MSHRGIRDKMRGQRKAVFSKGQIETSFIQFHAHSSTDVKCNVNCNRKTGRQPKCFLVENYYMSIIKQATEFLNSVWRLVLWSRAMWLVSAASWDRGPGVWKEVLGALKWSQLLPEAVAHSSLVRLEWFKFGVLEGIRLGWGRETMDSVRDSLSLARLQERLPTGKSDMWTWRATEGPDTKAQCGMACVQAGTGSIILVIITLKDVAGELTFMYVPGEGSLRDAWQAFRVYSFRHKLQSLIHFHPFPIIFCERLTTVSQELRYAQISPVRARLCTTGSSHVYTFPPPHCTPATPSTPQKGLGDSGEGRQAHERTVSCFWINSNVDFAVLTWLVNQGEEKIDDVLGLSSQTGLQWFAVLVSSIEGKC